MRIRCAFLALFVAPLFACGTTGWTLTISNQTGNELTYAPVETVPPPPHRVVTVRTLASGTRVPVDLDDFNPVWWDPVSNLGVLIQHAFESSPREVLAVVYQYTVPPGQEGVDPAKQPQPVGAPYFFQPDEAKGKTVRMRVGPIADQMKVTYLQE